MVVTGRLIAAMDVLQDHWERVDDANPDRQRHTIGAQTGPSHDYTESAPEAARRWAAD